ncbi:hypothetical protein HMPREF0880_03170 [Yokenella regensburgei ATCC 43003]|nr:hypothetical protein HMPREF0880_03170 [Yokenella regensburgei ATCC 43003]
MRNCIIITINNTVFIYSSFIEGNVQAACRHGLLVLSPTLS